MRFLVGLIGAGIGASGSPALHENEAAALGHSLHYHLIDLNDRGGVEALPALLDAAQSLGFAGVNITHPCKQAVIPRLDELSPDAAAIGAVNTVVFHDGKRHGHNTDWIGFAEGLRRGLPGVTMDRVALLGAGGAGAAVGHALLKLGTKELNLADTDPNRAAALAQRLQHNFPAATVKAAPLTQTLPKADGLVHATPTGMADHPGSAVDRQMLRHNLWVADIVYFPLETQLLRDARHAGCRTLDGGAMAVFQAAEAFHLFTGIAPDAERMRAGFQKRAKV